MVMKSLECDTKGLFLRVMKTLSQGVAEFELQF